MDYKKIAKERIELLFKYAEKEFKKNPRLSHRYAHLIRKIAQKAQVSLPSRIKKRICKKCGRFLVPGKNLKVRLDSKNKMIEYTCLECRNVSRHGYVKEKFKKS